MIIKDEEYNSSGQPQAMKFHVENEDDIDALNAIEQLLRNGSTVEMRDLLNSIE